jgi:dTDP-4-dehydrorhamnose 3,5-epimerase
MQQIPTRLEGLVVLEPVVHGDDRGFFVETFRESALAELGIADRFVQENHSRSAYGVVRGMHFQSDPPVAKLVRCGRGAILDVVVDIRAESPTFGEWEAVELDDERHLQLWIPVGFGHGFCVLSETADFVYKCTNVYDPATEAGIRFDDPDVGIEWPDIELLYSDRDRTAPTLADVRDELPFTV